jgi:hypothetical protein
MSRDTEVKVSKRSVRAWVGVIDEDGRELVKRRSVILHVGVKTDINLEWKISEVNRGFPTHAGLYVNKNDPAPKYTRPLTERSDCISGCCPVALSWWALLHNSDL